MKSILSIFYLVSVCVRGEQDKSGEGTPGEQTKDNETYLLDSQEYFTSLDDHIVELGEKFNNFNLVENNYSQPECNGLDHKEQSGNDVFQNTLISFDSVEYSDIMKGLVEFYIQLVNQSKMFFTKLIDLFEIRINLDHEDFTITLVDKQKNCAISPFGFYMSKDLEFLNGILSYSDEESKYKEMLERILEKLDLYIMNLLDFKHIRVEDLLLRVDVERESHVKTSNLSGLLLNFLPECWVVNHLKNICMLFRSYEVPRNLKDLNQTKEGVVNFINTLRKELNSLKKCGYDSTILGDKSSGVTSKGHNLSLTHFSESNYSDIQNSRDPSKMNDPTTSFDRSIPDITSSNSHNVYFHSFVILGMVSFLLVSLVFIVFFGPKIMRRKKRTSTGISMAMLESNNLPVN